MNIYFLAPEFDDWTLVINNLQIPNIFIINNGDINVNYLTELINNIIIPLKYEHIKFVTENFKDMGIFLCPDYKIIEILNNKIMFHKFMVKNNFQNMIPIMYKINNKILRSVEYPCILKLAETFGGYGSYICNDKYELKKKEYKYKNYFVQEFISGNTEYSAHLFIFKGIIKHGVCYSIVHTTKIYIQRGKMIKYKKIKRFDWSVFSKIFTVLNYTGFVCIDFKIVDNEIKIFEINPRLGGTIVNNEHDFNEMILYVKEHIKC